MRATGGELGFAVEASRAARIPRSPLNHRREWMTEHDGAERKAADRAIQAVFRGRKAQRAAPSRPSGAA
jgi:hypothetical protein